MSRGIFHESQKTRILVHGLISLQMGLNLTKLCITLKVAVYEKIPFIWDGENPFAEAIGSYWYKGHLWTERTDPEAENYLHEFTQM
jgi:hypothetical protein